MDREVAEITQQKRNELSFETVDDLIDYPQLAKFQLLVDQAIDSYNLFRTLGNHKDANELKSKIREMKIAQNHLKLVMNLDFNKPSPKMFK